MVVAEVDSAILRSDEMIELKKTVSRNLWRKIYAIQLL